MNNPHIVSDPKIMMGKPAVSGTRITVELILEKLKDFGELVFRQRLVHAGVVLLRLAGLLPTTKAKVVADVIQSRGAELQDAFSVIAAGNVRIRKRQP